MKNISHKDSHKGTNVSSSYNGKKPAKPNKAQKPNPNGGKQS